MQQKRIYNVNEVIILIKRYCVQQDKCQWDINRKLDDLGLLPNRKE